MKISEIALCFTDFLEALLKLSGVNLSQSAMLYADKPFIHFILIVAACQSLLTVPILLGSTMALCSLQKD